MTDKFLIKDIKIIFGLSRYKNNAKVLRSIKDTVNNLIHVNDVNYEEEDIIWSSADPWSKISFPGAY